MGKEVISQRQSIALLAACIIGSSSIMGTVTSAQQDVWLVILIAILMAAIMLIVYARIMALFPGKGIYEILQLLFGKIIGKIISLFFIYYGFYLGAIVIRNISEFIMIVSLNETPQCMIALAIAYLAIIAVRGGIEVISRCTAIFFPIIILISISLNLLSIPLIDFKNLEPLLYDGILPVFVKAFGAFTFPFAEVVIFLTVLDSLPKNVSPCKSYFLGMLIGGTILLIREVRTVLILGTAHTSIQYFASYVSVGLIEIGNFFQRIEATASLAFIITAIIKCSICLYAATKGISKVFNLNDHHKIAAPIGLLMAIFSIILFSSFFELIQWHEEIYRYFALPFQVFLPVMIWITAEIKTRITNKNQHATTNFSS